MKKGDLISIEFTGREKSTGKVFDTTQKEVAEKEGLSTEGREYGPVSVVAGNGEVLPGLDNALVEMKVGEKKKIELTPEMAFGNRHAQLVKVLPLSEFKKNNIPPVPGTWINANEMMGKVQSVSGGRVRVDFNPELAGKEVEYELKILKHFTDEKEMLDVLTNKIFRGNEKPHVKREGEIVTVSGPIPVMTRYQRGLAMFSKVVLEIIPSVKKVNLQSLVEKKDVENTHIHEDGTIHSNDAHASHGHAHDHDHEHGHTH
ncbi:MAG: peptidylprolyl isomerase [Candidatus Diapherotrites archaeon]|uniref:Peptidyl-prolyl cis-trans isomerase n=1 Tax=Candidatus Iainarchaeum sp. TaxID=3101447 RepID=A0A8T4C6Q3_9ARCH|nr:peptidylprolyl isomerase [Candidatus Diapherotrites archaeon]